MHKSTLIAVVVASLLVAYPLMMLGISAEQGVQQNQNSVTQMADSTTKQESKKLPTLTQNQMQQQQLEKLQQSTLGTQQTQNDELQMTEEIESQQEEDKKLSIISQEKMQQAQFEKFKELLNSVRDKHITVIQE
jgi:hypothetical protein